MPWSDDGREWTDEPLPRKRDDLVGKRVRVVYTSDPYTRLAKGTEGTVRFVDMAGTLHVDWDDGSKLGMIPGEDAYEVVRDDEHA